MAFFDLEVGGKKFVMTQLASSKPALETAHSQAFGYCFPKQDIAVSQKNAWRVVPFFSPYCHR